MGLKFKIVPSERKLLDKVTCDRCKKELRKLSEGGWNPCGEPYSIFHEPGFENFFQLDHTWGYFSNKDGQHHEAVLCENCYDSIFAGLDIKLTTCED